jgi:hypothetical protein
MQDMQQLHDVVSFAQQVVAGCITAIVVAMQSIWELLVQLLEL